MSNGTDSYIVAGRQPWNRKHFLPAIAVSMGASIVEKHFTKSKKVPGSDRAFSTEPDGFSEMVQKFRLAERAIGSVTYELTEKEKSSKVFRRSLFAVQEIKTGEAFTKENIRSIRPSYGLPPKYLGMVLGKTAAETMAKGTPLSWELIN